MRLVEFLCLMLRAHGECLSILADHLGDGMLLQILERVEDEEIEPASHPTTPSVRRMPDISSYELLEAAVQSANLPIEIQFYLWSYPHYRAFIESSMDLEAQISPYLVEEAMEQAKAWFSRIPFPEPLRSQLEREILGPWARFHHLALKEAGKTPLRAVKAEPKREE